MSSIGVFTIASKNYLAYVRVIMESVAQIHPEYKLFFCLADRVDGCFDPQKEPYTIVEVDQLGIPNFSDLTLRYDIMEFNTAVKPFMFRWLFDNTDLETIIYLDPDIQVFSRFDRLESLMSDGASVVLTPHITKPLEDGKSPSDYSMLQAGVFNLGFIAAQRCSESLDFMHWWGRHLMTQCVNDQQSNLFVDQKWCDLAPCLLDNFKVLRDVGYNVAYWNLADRHVAKNKNGLWAVNDVPLVFFHFSGVNPLDERLVSKHQNRFSWADIPEAQALFKGYNHALHRSGWKETHKWPYAFDMLPDSSPIHKLVRLLYRNQHPNPVQIEVGETKEYLREMCNRQISAIQMDSGVRITALMYMIYHLRGDLETAFSLNTSQGRQQFASWFEIAGPREYGLPSELTQQCLICEKAYIAHHNKKPPLLAYHMMTAVELPAKAITKYLPVSVRVILKRLWVALRARVMGSF